MRRLPALLRALDSSLLPFATAYLGTAWALWGDGSLVAAGTESGGPSALARWLCLGWIPSLGLALAAYAMAGRRGALEPWRRRARRSFAIAFAASIPLQLAAVEWAVHRIHADRAGCSGPLECTLPGTRRAKPAGLHGFSAPTRLPAQAVDEDARQHAAPSERVPPARREDLLAPPDSAGTAPQRAEPVPDQPTPERGGSGPARKSRVLALHDSPPTGAPASGTADASEFFADGGPRCEGRVELREGTASRTGPWAFYAENGRKVAEGSYRDGLRSGPWREWYEDGQPRLAGTYRSGRPQADLIRWHPNGRVALRRDELRTEDGEVLWLEERFYADGTRRSRSQLRDGRFQGPSRGWHHSGTRSEAGSYEAGDKDGLWLYWDPEGTPLGHERWERGRRMGEALAPPAAPVLP